jgi:outer membrane protein assembly factor BamB
VCTIVAALALAACSSGSGSGSATSSKRKSSSAAATTTTAAAPPTAATGTAAPWPTYYGDVSRTGLTTDGPASAARVHQVWASPALDGDVYAQPLVVGGHVIVATENDTVYSLDDSTGAVAWKTHLGTPVPGSSLPCGDVNPVGITSTPVADAGSNRVYAVGMVQPGHHVLFELGLSDGRLIDSKGVDAPGADPAVHNQRSALTLTGGRVYVAFGGRFGDCGDYHGRVTSVAVSPTGLGAVGTYTLPTQREGGFWSPPGPVAAPDGSLYLASGNSSSTSTFDYANAVVRLSADLQLLDAWAPSDWKDLNRGDTDLGSTSPVLLPGGRVFQVGKSGTGYLLDAGHLGGVGGELARTMVCDALAYGGVPHDGDTMFVSCPGSVVQVTAQGNALHVGWSAGVAAPGPAVIARGTVWTIATSGGELVALDESSGAERFDVHVGSEPSRFSTLAAGDGRIVVPADRTVFAFAD